MGICFVHTADWHLGRIIGQVPDEANRHWLAEQRFEAVQRIGEVAHQHGASFVVVAGDLFESHEVTDQVVARGMAAIEAIGLPVYAITGNHDFARCGPQGVWQRPSFTQHRPANLHLLTEPQPLRLEHDPVVLLPGALQRRLQTTCPCSWYHADAGAVAGEAAYRIGLAHGSVMGVGDAACQIIPDQVVTVGALDYLALGDWHSAASLQVGAQAWYSGTPEPTGFGQQAAGRVNVVRLACPGAPPEVTAAPVARSRWVRLQPPNQVLQAADLDQLCAEVNAHGPLPELLLEVAVDGQLPLGEWRRWEQEVQRWRDLCRLVRCDPGQLGCVVAQGDLQGWVDEHGTTLDPVIAGVFEDLRQMASAGGDQAAAAQRALLVLLSLVDQTVQQGGVA